VARFSLAGSSFDTLLGVYLGNAVNALTSRAQDDDSGGFLTSAVEFNVSSQTNYAIAIDGFAGAAGYYALSWELQAAETLPVITTQPASAVVTNGMNATFTVISDGTSFQWFFNGSALDGATLSSLTVTHAGSAQAGNYFVRVTKGTRSLDSKTAVLEIGQEASAFSQGKFEDLFTAGGGGSSQAVLAAASSGFVPVAAGAVDSRLFNNRGGTTQPGEPIHCGAVGGASQWFGLRPTSDGVLLIDTIGSGIDTVLAVYTGTDLLDLTMIACDDNSAPDGRTSVVRFPALAGTSYAVVVDGVNGAQGPISLNWRFGRTPTVASAPSTRGYPPGHDVVLSVQLSDSTSDISFQWQRNGRNLFEATKPSLTLTNLTAAQAGTYSVVIANFAGAITNMAAVIHVAAPVSLTFELVDEGGMSKLRLTAPASQGFVMQRTTNLIDWVSVYTNTALGSR
jgi:hypothetical protein